MYYIEAEEAKSADAKLHKSLHKLKCRQMQLNKTLLVRIKQQEVDLRAMDLQRKAEETRFKADQENQRF